MTESKTVTTEQKQSNKLEPATIPAEEETLTSGNAGAEINTIEKSQSESPKCEIRFITENGKRKLWVSKGCEDADSFLEAFEKVEDNDIVDFDTIEFEGGGEVDLGLPPLLEEEEVARMEQLKKENDNDAETPVKRVVTQKVEYNLLPSWVRELIKESKRR